MIFGNYLKSCREKYNLTQEQLSQELYNFNENFIGIDAVTISRWERAHTKPSIERIIGVLEFFQKYTNDLFPCFEAIDLQHINNMVFTVGVKDISKKVKTHIVEFPQDLISLKKIQIVSIQNSAEYDTYTKIAYNIDKQLTKNYSHINYKIFKEIALYPSSLFLVSKFQEQFFGLLFCIKLKNEVLEKIINFEMSENDITIEHLAQPNEIGSLYFISFFAISDVSVSALMLKLYTFLIQNQKTLTQAARVTKSTEGAMLSENFGMHLYKSGNLNGYDVKSHKASISDLLINEGFLKTLFKK